MLGISRCLPARCPPASEAVVAVTIESYRLHAWQRMPIAELMA